jgi:hypothetical protein
VRIDDLPVDVNPQGYLLVMTNDDRPGVVGHTGTVLSAGGSTSREWTSPEIAREAWRFRCGAWTRRCRTMFLAKGQNHPSILSVKMVKL